MSDASISLGLENEDFDRAIEASKSKFLDAGKEMERAMAQITAAQREALEMAQMRAEAAGDREVVNAIKAEIALRNEVARIMKAANVPEHEAIALAQEKLALQQKIAASAKQPMPEASGPFAKVRVEGEEDEGGHGGGMSHGGRQQLVHSTRAVMDMMMAGQSPMQAAQMEMPRVLQSLGGGLGAIAGVTAIIAVAKAIHDTGSEAEKLHEELQKTFSIPTNASFQTIEQIREHLKEVDTVAGKLGDRMNDGSIWGRAKNWTSQFVRNQQATIDSFVNGTPMHFANQDDHKDAMDALKERERTQGALAEKEKQTADAMDVGLHKGEHEAALMKLKVEYAEKIRAAGENNEGQGRGEQLAREYKLAVEEENKKHEAALRAYELEEKLLAIKEHGYDVDERSAQARMDAAKVELASAGDNEEKKHAAQSKISAAQSELSQIGRTKVDKAFARENTEIDATTGRGESEQFSALQAHASAAKERYDFLKGSESASSEDIAAAKAGLNSLIKSLEDMRETRARTNREAKAGTEIAELELAHHHDIADALATQLSFAEKIRQAQKDKNVQGEKELRLQQQIALETQARDIAQRRSERAKGSLGELAEHAFNQDGAKAREAQRLEARANRERMRGHVDEAAELFSRADKVRRGIGSLKDSEKDLGKELTGALDASEVLKEIKKNTAKYGAAL